MGQQVNGRPPVRRTVMQGALWSVPVLSVAAAAPAMAATCGPIRLDAGVVQGGTQAGMIYIRLTNNSSTTIPGPSAGPPAVTGTVITWRIQNTSSTTSTINSFTVASGPPVTFNPTSLQLTANAANNVSITIPSGGWLPTTTLEWRFRISQPSFRFRITFDIPNCVGFDRCVRTSAGPNGVGVSVYTGSSPGNCPTV